MISVGVTVGVLEITGVDDGVGVLDGVAVGVLDGVTVGVGELVTTSVGVGVLVGLITVLTAAFGTVGNNLSFKKYPPSETITNSNNRFPIINSLLDFFFLFSVDFKGVKLSIDLV